MTRVRKRHSNMFFKITIVFFALYLVLSLVSLQGEITGRKAQLETLQMANEEQRIANKELERILQYGSEHDYIERIAKEKLGFAYPDEQVLIDISGS